MTIIALSIAVILFAAVATLAVVFIVFLLPMLRGAPFYPAALADVRTIVALADIKPAERAVDLGSGEESLFSTPFSNKRWFLYLAALCYKRKRDNP